MDVGGFGTFVLLYIFTFTFSLFFTFFYFYFLFLHFFTFYFLIFFTFYLFPFFDFFTVYFFYLFIFYFFLKIFLIFFLIFFTFTFNSFDKYSQLRMSVMYDHEYERKARTTSRLQQHKQTHNKGWRVATESPFTLWHTSGSREGHPRYTSARTGKTVGGPT